MKEFVYNTPEYNLPDAFRKSEDSNNYKLLHINEKSKASIVKTFKDLFELLDIDKASGTHLDMYGKMFGVKRGQDNDDKYRIQIKGKIGQNFTDGQHDKVVEILAYILQCDISDIKLANGETTGSVVLKDIPLNVLITAGFDVNRVNALIEGLLPVGVTLTSFVYSGTFEFAATENEQDDEKGFSDENGTIGGYLGLIESKV